jgi:signal transduction histidine kinase/Sec-independent protein translocase protein TatA
MNSPDVFVDTQQARHAAVSSKRYRIGWPKFQRPPVSLRNWSVSQRLSTVIVIALIMGVVFGAFRITSAASTAAGFARTTQLAILGKQDAALAQAMENERDLTAAVCAASPGGVCPATGVKLRKTARTLQAELLSAQAATNAAAGQARTMAAKIGSSFPASTQTKAAQVVSMTNLIYFIRIDDVAQPAQAVITPYTEAIADLFALNDEITSSSGDALLADQVRTLGALSSSKDEISQERAIFYAALLQNAYNGAAETLTTVQGLEDADLTAFQSSATPAEESTYLAALSNVKTDTTQLMDSLLPVVNLPVVNGQTISPLAAYNQALNNGRSGLPQIFGSPGKWYSSMSETINGMRSVESQLAASIIARSQSLEAGARHSEELTAAVTIGVLFLVLGLTIIVARSLVNPLRRLQTDALEIASVRLPARVAELSESTDPNVSMDVEPISVQSTDEIGNVARAFDQVHREAIRLAGNEALLRGNLNAMFISLSRRSVPLIERLSRMIDHLEQAEDDPDRLSNLFSMDHLVTRMRRNSENLLVLAGEEPVRKWSEAVPLNDVARAAMSEIEQYGRVVLNVQPGIVISGQAASDVVHLLAEIIENATMFSPPDTSVHVSGQELNSGGVLLDVRDGGIGVSSTRMEEMNWRLENLPVIDVSVSRHMGLFAVSRLASRHGIRVRLRDASPQGLSVLIWLPGNLIGRASPRFGDRRSRQLEGESTLSHLRVGGRHANARQSLRAAEDDYAGNGSPRRESVGTAANWFGAKRPSGAAAQGASAHAAGMQAAGMQTTGPQDFGGAQDSGPQDSSPWAFSGATPASSGSASATSATSSAASSASSWVGGDWQPAEPPSAPAQGNLTASGLPTRVPRSNLFAGSMAGRAAPDSSPTEAFSAPPPTPRYDSQQASSRQPASLPRRSPEHARNRMRGFQLGSRDAEDQMPRAGEESSR